MKIKELIPKILQYVYLIVFIFLTVLIFIKAGESGEVASASSSNLSEYLQNNFEAVNQISKKVDDFPTLVTKFIGHYGLFALTGVFGLLTFISFTKTSVHAICYSAVTVTLISITAELIQFNTEGRTFSFSDIILNIQGYVSGSAISMLLNWIYNKKRQEHLQISITAYIVFILFSILTLFLYYAISNKIESVEICTVTEIIVVSVWIVIEGILLILKNNSIKKQNV